MKLTIASESDAGFLGQFLIAEVAVRIVVAVLEPLEVTLHDTLKRM
jgi:hypothetical protein